MHERVVEILLFLMNELQANKRLGDIDVTLLTKHGYTATEISSAFSWLFERLQGPATSHDGPNSRSATSIRHLHPAERAVMSAEGYGYLLQCHQLGLLTPDEVETVIERIMMAGFSSAGENEVKALVAGLLFDSERPSGGVPTLGPTDTIH